MVLPIPGAQPPLSPGALMALESHAAALGVADISPVVRFYESVFSWCLAQKQACAGPLFLGINGPQGSGKSALARALVEAFAGGDFRAVALSVDDFYLTHEEQRALAQANPTNRYFQVRGVPGTHDVELGARTLAQLAQLDKGEELSLPRYDKSAWSGAGDRSPKGSWPRVPRPMDVVILEGWMLGFPPHPSPLTLPEDLRAVDARLPAYDAWTSRLGAMVQLRMQHEAQFIDWRIEAEERMKRSGRPGMSREGVESYARLFTPFYAIYPELLEAHPPRPDAHRVIVLGPSRLPLT